jgi:hypothetical protein
MPELAAAPTQNRRRRKAVAFTTATIVSFSLTLLVGAVAVLFGVVPLHSITTGTRVDIGALLFVTPVVALVLAVCVEVVRIALRHPELPEPRRQQAVRWEPGRREG